MNLILKCIKKTINILMVLSIIFFIVACSNKDKNTNGQGGDEGKSVDLAKEIKHIAPLNINGVELLDYRDVGNLYVARVEVSQGGRKQVVPVSITKDLKMVVIGQTYDGKTGATIGSIDLSTFKKDAAFSFGDDDKKKNDFYVFTDPDCPYCKKLSEDLNKEGLGKYANIHFYLFPLESLHLNSKKKCEYILSYDESERPQIMKGIESGEDAKWENFKRDGNVAALLDKMKAIAEQLRVQGTPTIIDQSGNQVDPGIMITYLRALKKQDKQSKNNINKSLEREEVSNKQIVVEE